jgi:hypothetical protein
MKLIIIVNANIAAVQICNVIEKPAIISRKARLDRILNAEKHECYVTNSIEASLAVKFIWHKTSAITNIQNDMKFTIMKSKFVEEIIAHDTSDVRNQLFHVAKQYFTLWDKTEDTMIDVSENQWILVTLKFKARSEFVKIYSMRLKNRELIDEIFDKLHAQNKMR